MATRTVVRPVFISGRETLGEYKVPGVAIAPAPDDVGRLRITASGEAAAGVAEVWLAELEAAGHEPCWKH